MRIRLRHMVLFCGSLALAASQASQVGSWVKTSFEKVSLPAATAQLPMERSLQTHSFLLTEDWLSFPVNGHADEIRVVTNLYPDRELLQQMLSSSLKDDAVTYDVLVRLLDSKGALLQELTHVHSAAVHMYHLPGSDEQMTARMVKQTGEALTSDDEILINSSEFPTGVAKVEVRVKKTLSGQSKALVRVLSSRETPNRKMRYQWQRLGQVEKELMTASNIYGHDLLRKEERDALLKYSRESLSPLGLPGKNYETVDLLTFPLDVSEGKVAKNEIDFPVGLRVERGLNATLQLVDGAVSHELGLKKSSLSDEPVRVLLRWMGPEVWQRETKELWISAQEERIALDYEGGFVEVESAQSLQAQLYAKDANNNTVEVTPEPSLVPSYVVRDGQSLEFKIANAEEALMRFDVRALLSPISSTQSDMKVSSDVENGPLDVGYEMLDDKGNLVGTGSLPLNHEISLYDQMKIPEGEILYKTTEAGTTYLRLPSQVKVVRIISKGAAYVTAYTRPVNLPAVSSNQSLSLEDFRGLRLEEGSSDAENLRNWFLINPVRVHALQSERRVASLRANASPPDVPVELSEGFYEWEELRPLGDWSARHFVAERQKQKPVREQSLPSVFTSFPLGEEREVTFSAPEGAREVSPRFILKRDGNKPVTVSIFANGKPHQSVTLSEKTGEFQLNPFADGEGRPVTLRFSASEPMEIFLNRVNPGESKAIEKRMGFTLEDKPLVFQVTKFTDEEEFVSGHFFATQKSKKNVSLRVSLSQEGRQESTQLEDWTFQERDYKIFLNKKTNAEILGGMGSQLQTGRPFLIRLGRDLPKGEYKISLEKKDGSSGIVSLFRTTPGHFSERYFSVENRSEEILATRQARKLDRLKMKDSDEWVVDSGKGDGNL